MKNAGSDNTRNLLICRTARGFLIPAVLSVMCVALLLGGCGNAAGSNGADAATVIDSAASVGATSSDGINADDANADVAGADGENADGASADAANPAADVSDTTADADIYPAPDFTLLDQYGNRQALSAYRGKVVFLNFWATWCPPCRAEMPDIQTLYEYYEAHPEEDVVILGVAAPDLGQEYDEDGIAAFLLENGYSYPVAFDRGGSVNEAYWITAIPTTWLIDRDGNLFGYVTGAIDLDTMRDIIAKAQES